MQVRKLAWRNVWRNRRRSLVTISAMTLALLVMILYSGLIEGYLTDIESSVLDVEVGDIQIFAGDYRNRPSLYTRIDDANELLDALDTQGYPAAARLLGYGMAASGDASAGVSFRGVDVERDARVSAVGERVVSGAWLDPADPHGIVLGRRLAKTLGVSTGDEVLVLSQATDGSMAYDQYPVRGILGPVADATDRGGIFMTAGEFRELFVVPDGAHQILVRRPSEVLLPDAQIVVAGLAPEHEVKTWRELMPTVASFTDSARAVMVFMSLIIYIAVAILILNAMLMAVFERLRELGVLKALGVGPLEVMRLMAVESGIQAGLAIVVATTLSLPLMFYLSRVGIDFAGLSGLTMLGMSLGAVWRAVFTVGVYVLPIGMLLLIVALAWVYPASKAAWIRPVEAMRQR